MKASGNSGWPYGIEPANGSKLPARVRPAGASSPIMPVYAMPESADYGDEREPQSQRMRMLRRRWLLILGAAVLGALAGIAVAVTSTPVYRAGTSMQLEGFDDAFFRDLRPLPPMFANAPPESYVRNQVKLLQSETLALRVADRLGIRPDASPQGVVEAAARRWGLLGPNRLSAEQQRIAAIRNVVKVRTTPQSQVIELQYDAPDPEHAAAGANTVAAEFVALNQETRWQLVQDTAEWLSKQTADLKIKLESGSRELQDFARSSGLIFAGSQSTLLQDRLRQLQDALTKAETDRATNLARYEAAQSTDIESLPDLLVTGPLRQYQTDLQGLRRELADLKAIYTPAHYKVVRVEAQIASLESAITKERRALLDRLRTEYEASTRLERSLGEKNTLDLKQAQELNEKQNRYNLLKREVESTQQLYESMLQKVKEAGVASALRATNVRVLDPARPPARPYSPNLPLNAALGFAFGGLGCVGLVLVRGRSDRVMSPGETGLWNVPELGVIPSARDDRGLARIWPAQIGRSSLNNNLALVTWQQEGSLLSESFRTTLASILFGFPAGPHRQPRGRVLVITSREPGEGKTTVLTNLGIALAETDRRVLLIDADLRRPTLHEYFDIPAEGGLSDLVQTPDLIDTPGLQTIARETRVPNLWVLPSGSLLGGIPKLLYSGNLTRLLRRVRSDFDLILIDTPPVELYPESRVLGRISDGVVIVVRANRVNRNDLKRTCLRFVQDGIPVLGTILNDWRINKSEHCAYGQHYRHYYRPRAL